MAEQAFGGRSSDTPLAGSAADRLLRALGPTYLFDLHDQHLTVVRAPADARADCHVSADPATYRLLASIEKGIEADVVAPRVLAIRAERSTRPDRLAYDPAVRQGPCHC